MQNVDFLPERIKAHRRQKRRIAKHTYILTICLAGMMVLGFKGAGEIKAVQAELKQVRRQDKGIAQKLAQRDTLEREKAELYVIQKIDGQLGSRLSTFMLLSELQNLLPPSVVLTQLNVETMDVLAKGEAAKGTRSRGVRTASKGGTDTTVKRLRLTLTGLATKDVDVANFIGQVSACPLFEDVNMSYSRDVKIKDRMARQFQASCYVIP